MKDKKNENITEVNTSNSNDVTPKKKSKAFWIFYLCLVVVLAAASFTVVSYVKRCINEFENALPECYMEELTTTEEGISRLKTFVLDNTASLVKNDRFEKAQIYENEVSEIINDGSFTFEKKKNSHDANAPVYEVFVNGDYAFDLGLISKNHTTKLKILVISDWDLDSVSLTHEYNDYKVTVPSNFEVTLNNVVLGDGDAISDEPIEELEATAEIINVPTIVTYEVKELGYKPEITIKNNKGEDASYTWLDDFSVRNDADFESTDDFDPKDLPVDALGIAKNWSRFYMNELGGPNGGLATVQKNLVPGSFLDERASDYGLRGFYLAVTSHELLSINNEKVTNYTIYDEKCFSVDVYFKKTMSVNNGRISTDEFNNRLYFAYVEGREDIADGWYLVDVRTVLN